LIGLELGDPRKIANKTGRNLIPGDVLHGRRLTPNVIPASVPEGEEGNQAMNRSMLQYHLQILHMANCLHEVLAPGQDRFRNWVRNDVRSSNLVKNNVIPALCRKVKRAT